jgi:DNA end-binding protein Ku
MARSLWSGAITLGLIHVPVRLYGATPAASGHALSFHRLHDRCGTRIQNKRWCPHCDEEVAWEHTVTGYEIEKGRYAVVNAKKEDDRERGERASISIEDFIDEDELDPIYIDRAYWVVPEGNPKAYALLHHAFRETGRVAVARVLLRTRSHLAAVRAAGDHLQLATLFFPAEVTRERELPAGAEDVAVAPRDLALARELIDKMTVAFDPSRYPDTTTARLRELIAEGSEVVDEEDLTEALRQGLQHH